MEIRYWDKEIETGGREKIAVLQFSRLQHLLGEVLKSNAFYQRRLRDAGIESAKDIQSLDDLARIPFTFKKELVADQEVNKPFGTNLTYPVDKYVKFHQTSGTTGRPYRCVDTVADWQWWGRCWAFVLTATGVVPGDRCFFPFSFGPFVGFWGAFEGVWVAQAMTLPGGGLGTLQRLNFLMDLEANVLICTPSYALRLADEARANGIDTAATTITRVINAGEPGASIPTTKKRIEDAWGAKCFDHHGMSEVGAMSYECIIQPGGPHLNEAEFIFEVLDPATQEPADDGELVVTNLGRIGMPVIRYRTGDRVRLKRERCECGRTFSRLDGGIIGRVDDMVTVRGINVFPSAIENIVRGFTAIEEYSVDVYRIREMDEMEVKIEVVGADRETVASALKNEMEVRLAFRPTVTIVQANSLPRFELKAKRFFDKRKF